MKDFTRRKDLFHQHHTSGNNNVLDVNDERVRLYPNILIHNSRNVDVLCAIYHQDLPYVDEELIVDECSNDVLMKRFSNFLYRFRSNITREPFEHVL